MKLGDTPEERDANRWLILLVTAFIVIGVAAVAQALSS